MLMQCKLTSLTIIILLANREDSATNGSQLKFLKVNENSKLRFMQTAIITEK